MKVVGLSRGQLTVILLAQARNVFVYLIQQLGFLIQDTANEQTTTCW
jgi:hypothetical protein